MTDFKAGDKVIVTDPSMGHYGKTGVVVVVEEAGPWPIKIKLDNGKGGTPAYTASELKLVKPEPKFKVGDWVKVHGRHDRWDGTVGTVQKVSSKSYSHYGNLYTIHKNDVGDEKFGVASENVLNFFEGALEATESPKPKKGDWAKAVGYGAKGGSFEGRVGEVTQVVKLTDGSSLTTLKYPFVAGKSTQGTFDSKYIQAAEAPKPSFQVGTFVTFAEPDNDHWQGGKAEVIEGNGTGTGRYTTRVRIIAGPPKNDLYRDNKGHELNFDPAHLKLWEAPKPVKQDFGPLYSYAAFDAALTSNLLANGGAPAFAKGGKVSKPAPLKIYLAGPMSGIEHYNFPAFFTAARKLRAAGHTVFNPAENDMDGGFNALGMEGHEAADHGFSLREALKTDLSWICENADALVLLEGWESSKGVRAEMALAEALGLPKYEMAKLPVEVAK